MEYSEALIDHFHHPRNAGELDRPDAVAEGENPVCGDTLRIEMRIQGNLIEQLRWSATGCPPTIAAASAASVLLEGRSVLDARRLDRDTLATALGGIPTRKAHAVTLVLTTVNRALDAYPNQPQC
jgi:NifU-like protein involved in Fe-S cluster formation